MRCAGGLYIYKESMLSKQRLCCHSWFYGGLGEFQSAISPLRFAALVHKDVVGQDYSKHLIKLTPVQRRRLRRQHGGVGSFVMGMLGSLAYSRTALLACRTRTLMKARLDGPLQMHSGRGPLAPLRYTAAQTNSRRNPRSFHKHLQWEKGGLQKHYQGIEWLCYHLLQA